MTSSCVVNLIKDGSLDVWYSFGDGMSDEDSLSREYTTWDGGLNLDVYFVEGGSLDVHIKPRMVI